MMNLPENKNHLYEKFIEELEESILCWQKEVKNKSNDKHFNARKYLADLLGYKDVRIIYRFLDPNDNSRTKLGLQDIQTIIKATGDCSSLENFINSLKKENIR